jgi:hypothetical protein
MLISNLQQFLRLLAPPLAAAGLNATSQKNVTSSLEALADALEPFRAMNADQLADLLKLAQEYRETGKIPDWAIGKPKATAQGRAPKTPKAPSISTAEVVAKLRDIQERSTSLTAAQITEEVQAFSSLTGPQLKEVQKEFLGGTAGRTKPEQMAALQKKIENFRVSRDRVDGILFR